MAVHQLEVKVRGGGDFDPAAAVVRLIGPGKLHLATYDPVGRVHGLDGLPPGTWRVLITASGRTAEERRIEVNAARQTLQVVLQAEPGSSGPFGELIGVQPAPGRGGEVLDSVSGSPWIEATPRDRTGLSRLGELQVYRRAGLSPGDESPVNELRAALGPDARGVGRVVFVNDEELVFESGQVYVRFAPGVDERQRASVLLRAGVEEAERRVGVNAFAVSVNDWERTMLEAALGLRSQPEVLVAEPDLVRFSRSDSANAPLFAGCWDRSLARVDEVWTAHTLGDRDLVLGVVDTGLGTVSGAVEHPAFVGKAGGGSDDKIRAAYDFGNDRADHDLTADSHGRAVAGVAAGQGGVGAPGVAPDVQVVSAIAATGTAKETCAPFYWMARRYDLGAQPTNLAASTVKDTGVEAAVIVTAQGFFSGGTGLPDQAATMVELLASRARGGRGVVLVASAGTWNQPASTGYPADVSLERPLGGHPRALSVAATEPKLTSGATPPWTVSELRAEYAGFGADLAGPSSTYTGDGTTRHEPPLHHGVWAPTQRGNGYLPSVAPQTTTTTALAAVAGSTTGSLSLSDATHAKLFTWMHVGGYGDGAGLGSGSTWSVIARADNVSGSVVDTLTLGPGGYPVDVPSGTTVAASAEAITTLTAALTIAADLGKPTITASVVSTSGLSVGDFVALHWFLANDATYPAYRVTGLTLTSLDVTQVYGTGTTARTLALASAVVRLDNDYTPAFGGTSAAAPFVAGVAALLLSIDPELTWAEVAWILASTAERMDLSGSGTHGSKPDLDWYDDQKTVTASAADRWWSEAIGHGRVNAKRAADLADSWRATAPDLWIRSKVGDPGDGTGVLDTDESPDIWVSDQHPSLSPTTHVDPGYATPLWIYATIRNRGDSPSLEKAWARFFLCSKHLHPFDFEAGAKAAPTDRRAWETNNSGKVSNISFARESYFLGEVTIPVIPDSGSGTDELTVAVPWPRGLRPPPLANDGQPFEPCLLVEITPQDGGVVSQDIEQNHHLAWRSVTFVDDTGPWIEFLEQGGLLPMSRRIEVPASGTSVVKLDVRVSDPAKLDLDAVTITVTWHRRDGVEVDWTWLLGTSSFSTTLSPSPVAPTVTGPTDDNGGATSGTQYTGTWALDVTVDGTYDALTVTVGAKDTLGHTTTGAGAQHRIALVTPLRVALALDWSSSMAVLGSTGQSRWQAARDAANLYQHVFRALVGANTHGHRIGYVRYWADAVGTDQTDVPVAMAVPGTSDLVSTADPVPVQLTPTGSGLLKAAGQVASSANNDRQVVLVSDGHENVVPTIEDVRLATSGASYVPRLADSAVDGVRVHTLAIGAAGSVAHDALQGLAEGGDSLPRSYDGAFHATASTNAPTEAFALKLHLLSLIADTLGADLVPFSSSSPLHVVIEEGVDRMVCVVTDAQAFQIVGPGGTTTTATASSSAGLAVAEVASPAAGTWLVDAFTPSSTAKGFAVVDLALRARFTASFSGSDLVLEARITEDGHPVSGAAVAATVQGPQGPIGPLLLQHVATPSFALAAWRHRALNPPKDEVWRGLRLELLDDALGGASLALASNQVVLAETTPGVYTATVSGAHEGVWGVHFDAEGTDSSGAAFRRAYHASAYRPPVPDSGHTSTQVVNLGTVAGGTAVRWEVLFDPADELGVRLGPGLGAQLRALDGAQALPVEDLLDGTYRVILSRPPGSLVTPPQLVWYTRTPNPVTRLTQPSRQVRITLTAVEILDDQETRLPSPGEFQFAVEVRRSGAVTRVELPVGKHHEHLSDGETWQVNELLFDEVVGLYEDLELRFEATELDRFLFFTFDTDPMQPCTDDLLAPHVVGRTQRQITTVPGWRVSYEVVIS